MDWFLGIDATSGQLVADFEDSANGANHPVTGNAVVSSNVWHHVAATYGSGTWNLYLDGALDKTLAVGAFTPEATSIQHAALGTAMTSNGTAAGFFAGVVDEARVWNVVRSGAQILASRDQELTSGSGLIGRWGLNEASGTTATNSVSGGVNGTLVGGPTRVPGFVPIGGGGNSAPVATADSYSTPRNTTLTVAAPGVLANDTDADGDSLTAIKVSDPAHGTVTLGATGSISYVPTSGYSGPDSFTYKANDGTADSTTVTVSLTVNAPGNSAPVATADSYSTPRNTTLTVAAPGVLANDTDADGDSLTAIKVSDPAHGTVTLGATGSISYVPTSGYSGPDSFTYKANDGTADSTTVTVSLTVTDATSRATGSSHPTAASSRFGDGHVLRLDGRPAAQPADRRHGRRRPRATATGSSPPTAASSASATPRSTARPAASRSTSRSSGMAATPSGNGYWLVASDGGIFTFGDAALLRLHGRPAAQQADRRHGRRRRPATATGSSPPTAASSPSATPRSTARPAAIRSTSRSSAWRATPSGHGYWLVASDGGIFTFGDASFYRLDRRPAARPADRRAWPRAAPGNGYWLVASDGGIFSLRRRRSSTGPWAARSSTSPSWAWPADEADRDRHRRQSRLPVVNGRGRVGVVPPGNLSRRRTRWGVPDSRDEPHPVCGWRLAAGFVRSVRDRLAGAGGFAQEMHSGVPLRGRDSRHLAADPER